jgi:hypothetical protein
MERRRRQNQTRVLVNHWQTANGKLRECTDLELIQRALYSIGQLIKNKFRVFAFISAQLKEIPEPHDNKPQQFTK